MRSNFSFSHSVFKRLVSQGRQKVSLCGNGLTLHQTRKIVALSKVHFLTTIPVWLKRCNVSLMGRKGDNAGYLDCLHLPTMFLKGLFLRLTPFPTMLSKGFFPRVIKS